MMPSWAAVASLIGYRCESPEWRSGGADFGTFNIPTVATTSTCVKAGWIHLSRLFAIPLLLASLACSDAAVNLISRLRTWRRRRPLRQRPYRWCPPGHHRRRIRRPRRRHQRWRPRPRLPPTRPSSSRSPSPRPRLTSPTTVGTTGGGGSTRTGTDRTHARKFCCRRASSTSTSAQLMPAASKPVHGWPLSPER